MVQYCCVPGCKSSAFSPNIAFHRFPLNEKNRKAWIQRIRRDETSNRKVSNSMRVCSSHFTPEDYRVVASGRKFLKDGADPSIFPITSPGKLKPEGRVVVRNQISSKTDTKRTPKATVPPPAETLIRSHLEPEVVIKEEPVEYDEGSGSSLAYAPGAPLKVEFILPHDEGEWPSQNAPSTSKSTPLTSKDAPVTTVLEFTVEKDPVVDSIGAYTQQLVEATKSRKKKGTPKTDVVAGIDEKRKRDNNVGETAAILDKDSKLSSEEKKPKDEFDAFGEYIAMELRQLDWKTRAILQKAIGDLVFDAKMGKLKDQAAGSETVPN